MPNNTNIKSVGVNWYDKKWDVFISGFPRSGNNWVRYIVREMFPGTMNANHSVDRYIEFSKLVLVMRNYKESLYRHFFQGDSVYSEEALLSQVEECLSGNVTITDLAYIWDFFGKCDQPKHLVYYEDLISNPEDTIWKLAQFLECDCEDFLNRYEEHKQISLGKYEGVSYTKGSTPLYHSLNISKEIRLHLDKMVKEKIPHLIHYFERYFERS